MNPTRKREPGARGKPPQPPQPLHPPAFKTKVAPLKTPSAPTVKKSMAPPVYRPNRTPKVLQTKRASGQSQPELELRRPVAPAYRPPASQISQLKNSSHGPKPPIAPAVYQPQTKSVAQGKMAKAAPSHSQLKRNAIQPARLPTQAKRGTPLPSRCPTVIQRAEMFYGLKSAVFGNNVPEGVDEMKILGGGCGVGYNAKEHKVVLYDHEGVLAHVRIQLPQSTAENIILHTGTDKGEEGGQGHMMALFPVTLQVIQQHYSNYAGISLVPAPGAATKGLVSLLSRVRCTLPPRGPLTPMGYERLAFARRLRDTADDAKARRKAREARGVRKKPTNAQAFDYEAMAETAIELSALREVEAVDPMNMQVIGNTGAFCEPLVGQGSSLVEGGSYSWHKSAKETGQATLLMTMPMDAVPRLLAALPPQ